MRSRVSVFRNTIDDFIEQTVDGDADLTFIDNVSKARITGQEFELSYQRPRFSAGASYTRLRGRDLESRNPLGSIPADELTLSGAVRTADKALEVGARGRHARSQDRIAPRGMKTSGYSVLDLYAVWFPAVAPRQRLRIDVGIDNLMNRGYRRHLSNVRDPGRNAKVTGTLRF